MNNNKDFNNAIKKLNDFLELYLVKKAPSLPENAKEFLVKYAPIASIVGVVFSVFGILSLLGLGSILFVLSAGSFFSLGTIFLIITAVLEALSISGLKSRSLNGWNYLYYASLVNGIHSLLTLNIGNLLIGTGISLYFLFQVKSYYKN